jgi:hypothetical protein
LGVFAQNPFLRLVFIDLPAQKTSNRKSVLRLVPMKVFGHHITQSGAKVTALQTLARHLMRLEISRSVWSAACSPPLFISVYHLCLSVVELCPLRLSVPSVNRIGWFLIFSCKNQNRAGMFQRGF